ncbi:MAG: DNA polymerase [Ilumatobacteraceae bacterium]
MSATDVIDAADAAEAIDSLRSVGFERGDQLAVAIAVGVGAGFSTGQQMWSIAIPNPAAVVEAIETAFGPRWIWWSNEAAAVLVDVDVRVARCWDVSVAHRMLFGGWRSDPARVWAALNGVSSSTIPVMGQLDLLGGGGDDGDPHHPERPDGHLRPDWVAGGWATSPTHLAQWAATAMHAVDRQRVVLAARSNPARVETTIRSESVAELLCTELAADGLPIDLATADEIIGTFLGPRPRNEQEVTTARRRRDDVVLALPGVGGATDLRNPGHVRSMLDRVGVDVPDTRAWRLEAFRSTSEVVDALLTWRKAERIETTFGYTWIDQHVRDGRLRGAWSGSDGAAGRMTAQAGLHNMPADLRGAVKAEPGHVFVRADLGQIEPRVLAAVSGDAQFAAAAAEDDMYAPVAARLGVERSVAKIAVLAAMYGQTSGAAGQTLQAMEQSYPVAMQFLRDADEQGRAGIDVFTDGGRRIRMWDFGDQHAESPSTERAAMAARGRFARNAVVQGAAAELFKVWAVTVRARSAGLGARIVLCLHDELLVHVPAEHGEATARLLDDCLQEAAWRHFRDARHATAATVRFVADISVIEKWSDAKP